MRGLLQVDRVFLRSGMPEWMDISQHYSNHGFRIEGQPRAVMTADAAEAPTSG